MKNLGVMMQGIESEQEQLTLSAIEKTFMEGIKTDRDFEVGLEVERIPVFEESFKTVGYSEENGIYNLLRTFAKLDGWDYITDDYNIIGLKKMTENGEEKITLEPGCQFELSLKPEKNITELKTKIDNFSRRITPVLKKMGINLLEYGISPVSTYKYINLIPKKRYHIMADYLWGILSDVMMRETAGIQACFDYSSEEDAIRKFRLVNILSPFMTAMFANSPIRGGVDTGYKTFRGLSWLNCDNERCGFLTDMNSDFSYEFYLNKVLKTPMIFISRENIPVQINGRINFEEFMKNGFEGFTATKEDFDLHSNLCFPEVRMRNFIEIRNHDCVNHGLQYSLLAIYKGIFYDENVIRQTENLLSKYSYQEIFKLRYKVPQLGLEAKIRQIKIKEICSEIIKIAETSLITKRENEENFITPIKNLTEKCLTPADLITYNWNNKWGKNIDLLIRYINN